MRHLSMLLFFSVSLLPVRPILASQPDSLMRVLRSSPENTEALLSIMDYYKLENPDSLNKYYWRLDELKLPKEARVRSELVRIESLYKFNQYDSAYSLINQLEVDKSNLDRYVESQVLHGKILIKKNLMDEALTRFYQVLEVATGSKLTSFIPEINAEIAFILSKNNDLENCKKYFMQALRQAAAIDDVELQVEICHQLCRVYNGGILVNLDSSIYYGTRGLEIAKNNDFGHGYANMLFIVSAPIIRNGDYRRGLEMSREALALADRYNFPLKSRYYLILNQGFAYEKLGLYDSALYQQQLGAALRPNGIDHFRLKYLILKSKGDHVAALEALETYWPKKDSIVKAMNQNKLSSLQARLDADVKERELNDLSQRAELQELQLSKQRYVLFGLILLVIFATVGIYLVYRHRQLKQKQAITHLELEETRKRLEIEQQYRASELKALRSQMNPHFVFNALNSIQEYIMLNEKRLAGKYLGKFADLMRTYLDQSQEKSVTVQEEVDALHLYLELEKLRFEDSLDYHIHIAEDLDADDVRLPALLVQPFVENALKHGLLHKKGERKLIVSFTRENQVLICKVKDNGIGRKASEELNKSRNPNHKSYATGAIKERIELINYSMEEPVRVETLDVMSQPGGVCGTEVSLTIPLETFAGLEA